MGHVLYSGVLITRDDVCTVELSDITPPGLDGRKFRIEVTNSSGEINPKETREVGVSGTWLAIQPYQELDLLALQGRTPAASAGGSANNKCPADAYPRLDRGSSSAGFVL